MKARVKKAGWAHGRADKIASENAVREIVRRQMLRTAAERAISSRLCNEAIDKIMANWYQILPSREVKTQKHYNGHLPTVTYRAGGSGEGGHGFGLGFSSRAGQEDIAGLTVQQRHGATGNPVGRPPKPASEPTRSQGRAARLRRERRFDGTPQPAGITAVDWGMVRLSYVDAFTSVELAERFHIRTEVVRKRLSRARQAAKAEGHEFPK
jgi:hypothetical protein